jgi:8-oxo-dGTP pyrophosphatase MutT (NUDIX family)
VRASLIELVESLQPPDEVGARHREQALAWLRRTDDVYRRVKPATPDPHLVVYFLLVDAAAGRVLLCDHRLSGLWLPTGGHVEPGEDPADTVRREAEEELGLRHVRAGAPFLLTVTETVGDADARHTDVTLWYAVPAELGDPLEPDAREFAGVRWWSREQLTAAWPGPFEPHLLRALDALGLD